MGCQKGRSEAAKDENKLAFTVIYGEIAGRRGAQVRQISDSLH
jgi:hypothetical protein